MAQTSVYPLPAATDAQHTILVVDDAPDNLVVLSELLQPHFRVRAAISGMRALDIAHTEPRPDLILLDIMMPEMDGYNTLKRLRADPGTRDIPVIFVTALDAAPDEALGLDMAITLINEGRGSQFDPDLVDAFHGVRPVFAAIAARFPDSQESLGRKAGQAATGIQARAGTRHGPQAPLGKWPAD